MTARKPTTGRTTPAKRTPRSAAEVRQMFKEPTGDELLAAAPPTVHDVRVLTSAGRSPQSIRGALGYTVAPHPVDHKEGQTPEGTLIVGLADGGQAVFAPGKWESYTAVPRVGD